VISRLGIGIGISPTDVEARVQVRMSRQAVLTRPKPLEVWAVIHEAALTSSVGGPQTMRGQLDKLLDLSTLSNINIQVMPADASAHQGMNGPFAILGFSEHSDLDVVLIEGMLTSLWVEDRNEVGYYETAFRGITAEAWPLERSLDFIAKQRDKIT
jgi:hypothetical protein